MKQKLIIGAMVVVTFLAAGGGAASLLATSPQAHTETDPVLIANSGTTTQPVPPIVKPDPDLLPNGNSWGG
jgi:hypothetical protein